MNFSISSSDGRRRRQLSASARRQSCPIKQKLRACSTPRPEAIVVEQGLSNGARTPLSPAGFLTISGLICAVLLGITWLWTAAMPMAFLDPEYPYWRAKQALLAACDLGEIMVLGDSRATAAIMPVHFPVRTTNLAVAGGMAIEAHAALSRATRCPVLPRQVVISLGAEHFTHPDLFWERSVRFGFLDSQDVAVLRRESHRLRDLSVYELRHTDGLPSRVRDLMYQVRFPSLYFASLVKGGGFSRWPRNQAAFQDGLATRGQHAFGTASGSDIVAAEGQLTEFRPLPILVWYFDQLLRHLADHHIPAVFIAMPMNDATAQTVSPKVRVAFREWLAGFETRYSGFRVLGEAMPHWPDQMFGDGFAHLHPDAAVRFSTGLGKCFTETTPLGFTETAPLADCVQRLQAAPPNTQNDAQ